LRKIPLCLALTAVVGTTGKADVTDLASPVQLPLDGG
jgi:hypothetical protein